MKLRTKITIIVLIVLIFMILLSNLSFEKFFRNYLETQENAQVNSISKSVSNYLNAQINKYLGTVNDWSHWDDTYDFINGEYSDYISANLYEEIFANLDLSFIIFVNGENQCIYKQFYHHDNNTFDILPAGFTEDIEPVIRTTSTDSSGIIKLGGDYYFIAKSETTDSNKIKPSNGKMLIGRIIDENIITELEETIDCRIALFQGEIKEKGKDDHTGANGERILLNQVNINENEAAIQIQLLIPNTFYEDASVLVELTKDRDLFISGMKQINRYLLILAAAMTIFAYIIFTAIGKYISHPFEQLINEVKNVDLSKTEIGKMQIIGNDEFLFLRNSINGILSKIEVEQNKVRENKEKLLATITSVGDGVITIDNDGNVDFMNPPAEQLTGWKQEEAYKKPLKQFSILSMSTQEKKWKALSKEYLY